MQPAIGFNSGLIIRYGGAVLAVGAATLARWLLQDLFDDRFGFITYFPMVALVALGAGGGPAALATFLSACVASVWIIALQMPEAPVALALFVLSGLLISILANRLRCAHNRTLTESEERLRLALDAAEAGTWSWDVASNASYWDERYQALYGFGPQDPVSFDAWIGRVREEDRARLLERIQLLLQDGAANNWREEFRVLHPIKGERWMLGLGQVHRDGSGRALSFVGINLDITDRKKVETTICESEERLRAFLENSAVVAWLKDAEGRHVFISENCQRRFGMESREWQGKTDFELWPREIAEAFRRNDLAVLASGAPIEVLEEATSPNGSRSWWLSHKFPFRDASGKRYVGGLAVDITARKKVEAERQMFVSLADSSMEFIGICRQDFTPIYVNAAGLRMVGLENFEDAYRAKVQDFFFPEDQAFVTDEFLPRVLQDGHGEVEIRFRHFRTGEAIWMLYNVFNIRDVNGAVVGWATVSRNIHNRKLAEEALRASEQRLQLAQQVARIGTFDWNIKTGVNVWTPELEAMYGLSPGAFAKTQAAWEVLLHPDDRAQALQNVKQSLQTGQPTQSEWRVVWPDGSVHWISGLWQAFMDSSGRAVQLTGVNIDVTARQQAKEELQRLNRELEQRVVERTAALRAQQQRLRTILDTVASAIITFDQQGAIQSVNPAAERMFGFDAAELLGQNVKLLMPSSADDENGSYLRRLIAMGQARTPGGRRELLAQRKDGSIFPVELAISAVKHLQLFTGILSDITERKRAEEGLQQRLAEHTILNRVGLICSESRDENELLDRATALIAEKLYPDNCGFLLLDAARGQLVPHASFVISDPKVTRANIPLEMGITGQVARTGQALRVSDVSKHPAYLPTDSRTRSELCIPMKVAAKVVGVVNVESQIPDGFSATNEQLVATIVDLVSNALERLRSEEQLRRRERDLADFVENATVGLHWIGPDGRILWANRAELEMLGYRRDEYIGQRIADFHTKPEVVPDLLRRLIAGESIQNLEATMRAKDGSLRWVLLNANAYFEDGCFIHTRCFTRDISERKQLEREVVEIATLEQVRIGQDLHDDCGQELTALGLLADGLVESLEVHAPEDVAMARKIQHQAKGVLRQVRRIARGLARAEVTAEELPAALGELTARLAETSGVRCDFLGEAMPGEAVPGNGCIRATHLYHIAQEACTNALKHATAKNIAVRLRSCNGAVLLEIQDDGLGIPMDAKEGLGRRIMRNRANLIGARLTIEPVKPQGTLVTCTVAAKS